MLTMIRRAVLTAVVVVTAFGAATGLRAQSSAPTLPLEVQAQLNAALSGDDAGLLQTINALATAHPALAAAIAMQAAAARNNLAAAIAATAARAVPNAAGQIAGGVASVAPQSAVSVFTAVASTVPDAAGAIANAVIQAVPAASQQVVNALTNIQTAGGGGTEGEAGGGLTTDTNTSFNPDPVISPAGGAG